MDNKNKYKLVLITETKTINPTNIKVDNNDNYILEGEVAEFDVKNENDRIYRKNEYLPHLEYLSKRVNEKRLFGELDHPDKFDITLSNVSHLVESLTYDSAKNKVYTKIKLLDTTVGKNAKAIIKGGGVLSISSRSAGVVNESTKEVAIKKIFTYDLVAEPGFKNAQLRRINESLGIMNENLNIYEVGEGFINNTKDPEVKQFLNETLSEINKLNNVSLINEKNNFKTNKKVNGVMKDNKTNSTAVVKDVVTKEEMRKYSSLLKESFNKMSGDVQNLNKKVNKIDETSDVINKIISFNDYLVENFNEQEGKVEKLVAYTNYLANTVEKVIQYSNYLSKNVGSELGSLQENVNINNSEINKIKQYNNYLAENLNNSILHSDYLAENLDNVLNYTKYLGNSQEGGMQYMKYLSEQVDKNITYSDYLANSQNDLANYTNYLGEQLDNSIQHSDYLGENLQNNINYTKYVAKSLDNTIHYTEYVAENSLPKLPNREKVNESLSERINGFISLVDEREIRRQNEKNITKMLSESNALRFHNLTENEKTKVTSAILENKCINEEQIVNVWESVTSNPETMRLKRLMEGMPQSIKPIWENLTDKDKLKVQTLALNWDLSSPYKIKDFWLNQNLLPVEKSKVTLIKEKVSTSELYNKGVNENKQLQITESKLGYSVDIVKSKLDILKR